MTDKICQIYSLFSVTFCCCLCDCRIPKTGYDKDEEAKHDSDDCSDIEPAAVFSRPSLQGGKTLANGSAPQESHRHKTPETGHDQGKTNMGFDSEGETNLQTETCRGMQRVKLSRQP